MPDTDVYALRVCVLFALREESEAFRKQRHSFGWIVSMGVSGAGERNAAKHAALLMDDPGPKIKCLIICGFAGGLSSGLKPGDLVLANKVSLSYWNPKTGPDTWPASGEPLVPDSQLLAAASSVRLPEITVHKTSLVTTNRVLIHRQEKQGMQQQTHADAVDMETYAAAQAAEERDIPWLALRAITDGADDAMPLDFNALTDRNGAPSKGRIIAATLARPWKIPALIQLGKRSALAAGNMAAFLESLLQTLPD